MHGWMGHKIEIEQGKKSKIEISKILITNQLDKLVDVRLGTFIK